MLVTGIRSYNDASDIFGRFASIFNINNTSMVEIDPDTNEPFGKRDAFSYKKDKEFYGVFELK